MSSADTIQTKIDEPLGIVDILRSQGFDASVPTKLVRHQDKRYDVKDLIREGWFDLYQAQQSKPIFDGCQQVISLIGCGGNKCILHGIYEVIEGRKKRPSDVPAECPYQEWGVDGGTHYDLRLMPDLNHLAGRLVIDWGGAAISWHQWLCNKPVFEIKPPGRALSDFSDYLDFSLTHEELGLLAARPEAHADWISAISAVAGVYLILNEATGQHYVGSAYGTDGIWGRWRNYAANGHGGNKRLKMLLADDPDCTSKFRYSVLQVLPRTLSSKAVIAWESRMKEKLGSRAHGLNAN